MGALYSKSRKTDTRRTQPPSQSDRQPGQHAPQNPEPISVSPNPYISNPSPPSQSKEAPISASRPHALGETGRSNREHPPQVQTPRLPPGGPCPDTQTRGLEEGTPDATSDRTGVQLPRSAVRGASGASGGVRQMPQPEVDKVKATKDRRRRSPQAADVPFPRESRLRNHHSKGRLAIDAIALVDRSETPSTETTKPPPTVISPSFQIPHPDADNIQPLDMPFEPPLYPFIHQRQRSVFKRIDCVLRGCPHLKNGDRSSLKPSASTTSLPELTASIPPQLTELGQESPCFPTGPTPRRRPCYSLSELKDGISLNELRDGLLQADGKPSVGIEALDCTNRLSERTAVKGAGAYSDVSQAKLDNRLVAVKALRATNIEGTDEIRMRKRLGREIHVWAALRHPNILEFLGFAFEGGAPCLISPWCKHGTLSGYLKRYRGADRGSFVYQIAEGLNYLHHQNPPVVHGDLKPANVLITEDHIAKICDFGVSKHLGEGKTGFTTEDFASNTLRYSAPETLMEGGHHTLQSDVYSFACVTLEIWSSKYPYWRLSKGAAIITKVVIDKETPLPGDHPALKEDRLWELLRRWWSYEPSDRPKMFAVCRELAMAGYRPSHHPLSGCV